MIFFRPNFGIDKKIIKRFSLPQSGLAVVCTMLVLQATFFFGPGICQGAPVYATGLGWQTTLDRNDRILTYSFDHTGGYSFTDEGIDSTSTSLDILFKSIPDWETSLQQALDAWGESAEITFKEVDDNGLDLGEAGAGGHIRFSAHPLAETIFAHGFMPMETGSTEEDAGMWSAYGDVHFGTDISWRKDWVAPIATHELGHALGLSHNLDPYSIMHPFTTSGRVRTITARDESDLRAIYFPVNVPAEVISRSTVAEHRDWFALADGTWENRKTLLVSGHIDTDHEQKTGIKGVGASLSIENYGFDHVDLTLAEGGRITTRGGNAYGMAVGDFNTISMNGMIETHGISSDGISVLGSGNTVTTGAGSMITTHGSGSNGAFIGGDWGEEKNDAILGGNILTTGAGGAGVFIYSDDVDLRLDGSITTLGDWGVGIFTASTSSNTTINLSSQSRIVTADNRGIGVYLAGSEETIVSSGTITTTGIDGFGILLTGSDGTIVSSGTITTTGSFGYGVWLTGPGGTIDFSGTITTTGRYGNGLWSKGVGNTITHTGQINTAGEFSRGIYMTGGDSTLIHGGTIETNGLDSTGILIHKGSNLVDLSGDVTASRADAVRFTSSPDEGTNKLLIHGSPKVTGNMVNDGPDDGVTLYFGAYSDPETGELLQDPETCFVYDGSINGGTWIGEVVAGTTRLNGSDASFSLMTINPGATLGGDTLYTGNMVNNGTLAPGNSIGTIRVAGDYTQAGNLAMEIGNTGSDLLEVSGGITFQAGSSLTLAPVSPVPSHRFTLVTADAGVSGAPVLGTMDTLLLDFTVNGSGSDLFLDVTRKASYQDLTADTCQESLAFALDSLIPTASGDLAKAMAAMDMMNSRDEIQQACAALNPEEYGALTETSIALTRNYTHYIHQVLEEGRMGEETGRGSHGRVLNLSGRREGSPGFTGFDWDSYGLGVGVDQRFPHGILGIGAAILDTRDSHDGHLFSGDSTSFMGGVYSSVFRPGWHVDAQVGYARHKSDTRRTILMNGFADRLEASMTSNIVFASLEGGIDHAVSGTTTLSPFVGLDYLYHCRNRFDEGDSTLGVQVDRQKVESSRSTLGIKGSTTWKFGKQMVVFPALRLAWVHELGDARYDLSGTLSNQRVDIEGYDMERDRALASLDLAFKANDSTDLVLGVDGEWDRNVSCYGFQASFVRCF